MPHDDELRGTMMAMTTNGNWLVLRFAAFAVPIVAASGCADLSDLELSHPSVAPAAAEATASLEVGAPQIQPMYRRMLTIDLPTVVRVVMASNLDIQEAQRRVEAARGAYDSSVGAIVPTISPNITAVGIEGAISNGKGGFVLGNFSRFSPAALIDWIINPGQVAYDLIASKRRLEASAQEEQAVVQEATRLAVDQYYDLALAQTEVSVARQAVNEAEELLRLERLKLKAGTGLPADELRAEAALAAARQDLLTAINGFYNASITLTVTLHLDSTVMLVPRARSLGQTILVRNDLPIDDMLTNAVRYRPDLAAVRSYLAAAEANKGAAVWGGLGPTIQAAGTIGPPPPVHNAVDTEYREQKYAATGGFNWSAATFGRIESAVADVKIAGLDLDRKLDQVRAAVVSAHQASLTDARLIPIAKQQVSSAEEALRLTQENLKAGTGLTIDVLQAEATADQARARYAGAIAHFDQAQIDLLAAMGVLDSDKIAPANDANSAAVDGLPH